MIKLGRLIETKEELVINLTQVELYLNGDNEYLAEEMRGYIGRGIDFVAYYFNNEIHFAPSRFIGYLNNKLEIHRVEENGKNGWATSDSIDSILSKRCVPNAKYDKLFISYCKNLGVIPKKWVLKQRKYWILNETVHINLQEGGVKQISTNRYERNPEARRQCIEKYGTICKVCGLNFKDMYGDIGEGFIHVHHIIPLSQQKEVHIISEANLIPVCPNCHAMLHRGNVSVEELQRIIKKHK